MSHKQKVKLAKTLTPHPLKGDGVFGSPRWITRKMGIADRVQRQQERAHRMALEKKEKRKVVNLHG